MITLHYRVVTTMLWLCGLALLILACDSSSAFVLRRTSPPASGVAGSGGMSSAVPDAGQPPGGSSGTPSGSDSGSNWVLTTCTPQVVYDNRDALGSGALFDQYVTDPEALIHEVAQTACSLLYRQASEVRDVPTLSLIIEDFDGLAASSGTAVHISSRYLQQLADDGQDLLTEIHGLLYFTVTNHYQNNSNDTAPIWLITGVADWVRLQAGYTDAALRQAGGSHQDGYRTTAFFLDWLNQQYPNFVHELNSFLGPTGPATFMDNIFSDLTGKTIDVLWLDYQATL